MAVSVSPRVVGRDGELTALHASLDAAIGGLGGAVAVTGEPGIGKSRLVHELGDWARASGLAVAEGRAVPTASIEPYRPLTEALLGLVRDLPLLDDAELSPWLPYLAAVLPTVPGTTEQAGNAASIPARGEAVQRVLGRVGRGSPVVMILEDLQWADPDTLALFEYLADGAPAGPVPVLWVATCRDHEPCPAMDVVRRLRTRRHAAQVPLGRLTEAGVAEMVQACHPHAGPDVVARVERTADGVPLLVEEVLASPGVPPTVAEMVRARLGELDEGPQLVLGAAAVLGRHFDWRLLPASTGLSTAAVADALERGVESLLLSVDGDRFRFRHALTREAIAGLLLAPRRSMLAAATLDAVEAAHPELESPWRELAADLAVQAGDEMRAGLLLAESGRASCRRGALATGIDALRRALDLTVDPEARAEVEADLIDALALAGRVDEAMVHGTRLIASLGEGGAPAVARAGVHVRLAHAAVEATRWTEAQVQLDAAKGLLAAAPASEPALAAAVGVLDAEVALAGDRIASARSHAEAVLRSPQLRPEVRCHALELVGRSERLRDLAAARSAFELALATAEAADLPIWRLRALHELGTVELFASGAAARLGDARQLADQLGALSTAAVLDVQLAAAASLRFAVDDMAVHADSAVALTEQLGLGRLKATALNFLAEAHALRRDRDQMERSIGRARSAAPSDPEIDGVGWACRASLELLEDDRRAAAAALERAVSIMSALPQAPPGPFRGFWPLLLAVEGDARTEEAIDELRASAAGANCWNRGLVAYAEAVVAGRNGQAGLASEVVLAADADLAGAEVWPELARLHAAESAMAGGWGRPTDWLHAARETFARHGLDRLVQRCDTTLLAGDRWAHLGVTAREHEVLALVAEGLANKEIAARLGVSARTIEKHVESLLRKTGSRSRTHLVSFTGTARGHPG